MNPQDEDQKLLRNAPRQPVMKEVVVGRRVLRRAAEEGAVLAAVSGETGGGRKDSDHC